MTNEDLNNPTDEREYWQHLWSLECNWWMDPCQFCKQCSSRL